nr:flagellar basal-body MS-ring/collar protein FliF [Parvularcula dongshanensis]
MTLRQRIVAGGAVAAVVLAMVAMVGLSRHEDQALLMSGLADSAAGEVMAELDGLGVAYTVKGTSIYVPQSERDRLRLELARRGLPRDGEAGYELLDDLDGFSTTADMFDAAYWRAKEGELARTIRAMPGVHAVRVHLGVGRESAFRRNATQKTASVTIEAPLGLTKEQARAVQTLTALSVAGLSPDQVAVIDSLRGVVAGPGTREGLASLDEDSRAAEIEGRLVRLLEARVGPGNARVSASVEIDRDAVRETERVVDPDGRQIAQRSLSEESDTQNASGGVVTVASNLPDGDLDAEDGSETLRRSRQEEVVYTGTEIERHTERLPGAISRLSVAVLLNEADGEAARTPEELSALRALVASAAGIDEARGDTLALRTLAFTQPEPIVTQVPGFVEAEVLPRAVSLLQMGILGVVVIVLGVFVVRPLLSQRAETVAESEPGALPKDAVGLLTVLVEESPDDAAAVLDAWLEDDAVVRAA